MAKFVPQEEIPVSDQVRIRREKLENLRREGFDPFQETKYEITATSQEIKDKVIQTLDACGWQVDTVLSHTCPYPYEPREAFLPMIDQSTVDDSTEKWLEEIERKLKYDHWFCGHWHIDKHIDRMHFLFHSVEAAPQLLTGGDTL